MIDVNNESGTEVDELGLLQLAEFALAELRIHPQAELSILLVDEAAMAELHQRFMDQPGPTDVMSFPMDELQAPENGREPAEEIQYLLIHGLLHLLGHDHADAGERAVMFGLNDRIIADWRRTKDGQ